MSSSRRWWWVGAACLVEGCTLIDYERQASDASDAAGIEPVQPDATVPRDGEAGRDRDNDDDEDDEDGDDDEREVDASLTDAALDAPEAAACTALNQCGGCGVLARAVGDACGMCGVGRYACDGAEQLTCADDGPARSPGNPVLVDDLEDGDANILGNYGMSGAWYMISDGSAGMLSPAGGTVPLPVEPGALGSARAMHFTASGFTRWGAGLSASLNSYGCSYDASQQTGVEFYVKGSGTVLVSVATTQTVPPASHGTCVGNCNDLFSLQLTAPGSWTQRKVTFASLKQAGWGTPATFDPTQILYVQFSVPPNASLDLYVDNLSFY